MAVGVALAGLAIGVHFSSAPSSRARERGSEGGSERGHLDTSRRSASPVRDAGVSRSSQEAGTPRLRSAAVASQVEDRSRSASSTPPDPVGAAPRLSGEGIAAAPKASVPPAESQPVPPTDELSPGAPARPAHSPGPGPTPSAPPSHSLTRSEAALEIAHGPTEGKRIALTFDAGSSAAPTPAILAALRANGLHCTFFLTGRWTETNPGMVRQIVDAGHELGNHTYTHPDLTHVSDEKVKTELEQTEEEVQRVTGRSTKPYFRPPFGARDARVLRLAAAEGYRCIYWTTDSWDSVKKGIRPREIEERVLRKARPGSIILMHCGSQATADALPDIIRSLKAEGYEIVTVSDLLNGSP
jgi:peptidoglycan/xylan/chitin deacetylase (PgdA/CDA1 family)